MTDVEPSSAVKTFLNMKCFYFIAGVTQFKAFILCRQEKEITEKARYFIFNVEILTFHVQYICFKDWIHLIESTIHFFHCEPTSMLAGRLLDKVIDIGLIFIINSSSHLLVVLIHFTHSFALWVSKLKKKFLF